MTEFDRQVAQVSDSYDRTIEYGMRAVNLYKDLPLHITSHPAFEEFIEAGGCGSDSAAVRRFLDPQPGMRFVDLGCSANIINYRLHEWPSEYHGIDSSPETVRLLRRHVAENGIAVGGLHEGRIDALPFGPSEFDIAALIGVLEYYPIEYSARVLPEIHRVLVPGARFYLDIPNMRSRGCEVMCLVEESMGRPILLRVAPVEFEKLLPGLFSISSVDSTRVMTGYCLVKS